MQCIVSGIRLRRSLLMRVLDSVRNSLIRKAYEPQIDQRFSLAIETSTSGAGQRLRARVHQHVRPQRVGDETEC